jgi:Protein of unknown function (DUF1194)
MRWCVSIGAVLAAGAIAAGDVAGVAAPDPRSHPAAAKDNQPSVDVELVIAVDVSYSMDLDELAVQREGYARAMALSCPRSSRRTWDDFDIKISPVMAYVDSAGHVKTGALLWLSCSNEKKQA